jgi:hypothetical protein
MSTKRKYTTPKSVAPGRGRKSKGYVAVTLRMVPAAVAALDKMRGNEPRGEYVAGLLAGKGEK